MKFFFGSFHRSLETEKPLDTHFSHLMPLNNWKKNTLFFFQIEWRLWILSGQNNGKAPTEGDNWMNGWYTNLESSCSANCFSFEYGSVFSFSLFVPQPIGQIFFFCVYFSKYTVCHLNAMTMDLTFFKQNTYIPYICFNLKLVHFVSWLPLEIRVFRG